MHFLLFVLLSLLLTASAAAEELVPDHPVLRQAPSPLELMVGESYVYDIDFLWFDDLAEGRISFSAGEKPNTFRAVLEARTLGLAAWLTGDREQRYVSVMEQGPDGRLRSLLHESHILKGKGRDREDRINRYTFEQAAHQVHYQKIRGGKLHQEQVIPLPAGASPNDFLTAFYNFRIGALGPLEPGVHYLIPTFSRKGTQKSEVWVLTPKEREKFSSFPRHGQLCRVNLDEEIFDTAGGAVYLWIDESGRPARGIVENVLGLGNVNGKLRN